MSSQVFLGLGGTVDYELAWDHARIQRLCDQYAISLADLDEVQPIITQADVLRAVLRAMHNDQGGEYAVHDPGAALAFAEFFDYRVTLGGTCVRAALAADRVGVGSTVHLVSISDEVRERLTPGIEWTTSATRDTVDPHIIVQFPPGARLRLRDGVTQAPTKPNRVILVHDEPNRLMELSDDFEQCCHQARIVLISGLNAMHDRALLEQRLARIDKALTGATSTCVIFEDAGYHDESFRQSVLTSAQRWADVFSMNEDEAQYYVGHSIDFSDPQHVVDAFHTLHQVIGVPTLIVHTAHYAAVSGEECERFAQAAACGCQLASTRFACGDQWTEVDVHDVAALELDPVGQRLAKDPLIVGEGIAIAPSYEVTVPTPTTIGLGDAFIGGVVASLARQLGCAQPAPCGRGDPRQTSDPQSLVDSSYRGSEVQAGPAICGDASAGLWSVELWSGSVDGGRAVESKALSWEELDARPIPAWYQQAKFGIFIHWGPYSVPAWRSTNDELFGSYAEWYYASVYGNYRNNDPTYHANTWGEDFSYRNFGPLLTAHTFEPDQWADLFARAHARYVVLTSKHHDGYCMWPTTNPHKHGWNSGDTGAHRDLLGELAQAVRAKGMRMGVYYSMPEWEVHPSHRCNGGYFIPERDVTNYEVTPETYVPEVLHPQWHELNERYLPSLIFTDGGEWDLTEDYVRTREMLTWLYTQAPNREEVVVNDRMHVGMPGNHGDYYSTEYDDVEAYGSIHPWEESRGIGKSYGYNQAETLEDYASATELIDLLIRTVGRGGNLLLNVGPTADGQIPDIQRERLEEIGSWLDTHGVAIFDTTPFNLPLPNGIFATRPTPQDDQHTTDTTSTPDAHATRTDTTFYLLVSSGSPRQWRLPRAIDRATITGTQDDVLIDAYTIELPPQIPLPCTVTCVANERNPHVNADSSNSKTSTRTHAA